MDQTTLQRVRFTGKRTGLETIAVKGIGRVSVGQTIEVSEEEAENWTAPVPMRDGKEGSDFVKVGGPFKVDRNEVMNRRVSQREKLDSKAEDDQPEEVNTEMAHPVMPETGTVEEMAEVVTAPPADAQEETGNGKGRRTKDG